MDLEAGMEAMARFVVAIDAVRHRRVAPLSLRFNRKGACLRVASPRAPLPKRVFAIDHDVNASFLAWVRIVPTGTSTILTKRF